MRRKILCTSILLALALAGCDVREDARHIYYATTHWIVKVPTESMLPTIKPGSRAAVDTGHYAKKPVRRFDMVVVQAPAAKFAPDAEEYLALQRVIGLGGENIQIRRGSVYVNGTPLVEPFAKIPHPADEEFGPLVIPEGEYFLMGDNRPNSLDGRFWIKHTIGMSRFKGKVVEIFLE